MAKVVAAVVVNAFNVNSDVIGLADEVPAEEVLAAIDEEIALFDQYFQQELELEPLIKFEKACLKTYLQWKTKLPK